MDDVQKVIALPSHGKLPPDEQQKIFEDYGEARKIIFSTNVAETSVTIPGVCMSWTQALQRKCILTQVRIWTH